MTLYGSSTAHPSNSLPIEGFSGVLCLGCGDAMVPILLFETGRSDVQASIVGKKYGTRRWPRVKKTVEGTIAFTVAVILGAYITAEILPQFPFFTSPLANVQWPAFIASTLLTGARLLM
jgi:dolichol kinase